MAGFGAPLGDKLTTFGVAEHLETPKELFPE
jgi:hypothetical protein